MVIENGERFQIILMRNGKYAIFDRQTQLYVISNIEDIADAKIYYHTMEV